MNDGRKWAPLITFAAVVLIILPLAWGLLIPNNRSGMMQYAYGWHMPMMYAGNGMMGIAMLLMWLNWLGLLVLIGLGIVWLVRALNAPPKNQN
jgi:hypothetical protein